MAVNEKAMIAGPLRKQELLQDQEYNATALFTVEKYQIDKDGYLQALKVQDEKFLKNISTEHAFWWSGRSRSRPRDDAGADA